VERYNNTATCIRLLQAIRMAELVSRGVGVTNGRTNSPA